MKLKLDENLPQRLKPLLADLGHDTCTAADEGLLGMTDALVGKAAAAEGRMLFTLDLDFSDLRRFPPGQHPGIVLFRPVSMGPGTISRFIEHFVRANDLAGFSRCLVIAEPHQLRIRRPPDEEAAGETSR